MKKETGIPYYLPMGRPLNPLGQIVGDPLGSYTGVPEDEREKPVQDADDL